MILFLDFDGVLHPEGEGHLPNDGTDFCFLLRLEALLRDFPHVGIVISSMWSERLSLDELRSFFSPDIGARIIGATPPCSACSAGCPQGAIRRATCTLGANARSAHGLRRQPWVAVDDAEWQFDRHVNHLVACGSFTGFDDQAAQALRAHLEASRP